MRATGRTLALVTVALVGTAVIAIVADGSVETTGTDRAVLVRSSENGAGWGRNYSRLVEVLPNARSTATGTAVHSSVVVGAITAVSDGVGIKDIEPTTVNDKGEAWWRNEVVAFDSPTADWRTLRVSIAVSDTVAGQEVRELELDWAVMGTAAEGDDAAVERALRGLGKVMVFSVVSDLGSNGVPSRRLPDPQFSLALVGSDGSLSFPFVDHDFSRTADHREEIAFMDGVDTVEKVRAESRKPTWTRKDG